MTPDEELKILKADWAALVAQVSGGEGANLRRDETHPNSGGIAMSKEIMQQALDALMAGPDVDPIFAGETEEALRAALAAPQDEPVAHIFPSDVKALQLHETWAMVYSVPVGSPDERSVPLYTAPPAAPSVPAAPQGEAHALRTALHQISLASQNSMSSKEECGRIARNALHAVAPLQPVATVTSETGADISMSWWHEPALPVGTKLYTAPPAAPSGEENER